MKKVDDDKLRDMFREISFDEPSSGFENRLMQHIEIVAAKQNKKKILHKTIYNVCALIAGVAAIIILPCVIIYFAGIKLNYELPSFKYSFKMPDMDINPIWILMCLSVLILLVADMFIRKHLRAKNSK